MTSNLWAGGRRAAVGAALLLTLGVLPLSAQAAAPKAVVSSSDTVTATLKITAIDHKTRHVTVASPNGEHFTLKASDEIRNFDQMRVGDTIRTRYTLSTDYVLSKPNAPLPKDAQALLTVGAAKGDMPAGVAVNHITVTGAVVGVDKVKHRLTLVSPKGGEVFHVAVTRPEGVKALQQVKVGDTITAYVSESLLIAVNP